MWHGTRAWGWLAGVSILALLVSFDRAVHRVVTQGEDRRTAERERHSATWRCGLLPTRQGRADCRAALH